MTVLALVQFSIATPICLFVASVIYNVFFHPLRHYPGPWLSAATKIPWYRALLTGDLSFYTQRIHEKYGDIVRISPNELSYITAGAWKDVYANRVNHTLLPKDEKFYHPPPGGAHSILTAPHEAHSRIRRLLSHAFSEKALRDQESLIKVYVDLLVQRLHEESNSKSASLDMVSWYNWTTFDIFGDLMFAEPFGCLDSASYHPWVDLLFKSIKAQTLANAAAHLGILPLLRRFPPKRLVETRLKHMSMTTEKVTKRLDLKTDRADFMGFILKHNDDEFAMSLPEIKSTSFGIIIAGSETTATLLSGTTYYLLKNPEKLAKLTKEVREAFHSEDEINLTSVNGLTYMLAVLDEGLRMYPPVPVGLPRRVPESGETIVGNFVPPNTVVSVNHWAAYRSPRNFSQPESFIPERWLDDTDFSDNKRVFQPFSTGPRACIGRNLAYVEMKLILARIVWNFDMEIDATSNDWANQKMFILWDKPPLLVRMTSRPDLQTLKYRSKNSEKV